MAQVLTRPKLARCDNRYQLAKVNPQVGEPERWLTPQVLGAFGYVGISFDFFVNWSTLRCADEVWIKRISSIDTAQLDRAGAEYIKQAAASMGDDLYAIHDFAHSYGLLAFYRIFRDSVDWASVPEAILRAEITDTGLGHLKLQSLQEVMDAIRLLSGGPVTMGYKGLMYGTSTLECYLSGTNALWPGDVDSVLWNPLTKKAVAILEFKKHTLSSPIGDQCLSNYYPRPDGRKYNRLALLRNRLGKHIPLIIVYYPTDTRHDTIKLERVSGEYSTLTSSASRTINYKGKTSAALGYAVLQTALSLM